MLFLELAAEAVMIPVGAAVLAEAGAAAAAAWRVLPLKTLVSLSLSSTLLAAVTRRRGNGIRANGSEGVELPLIKLVQYHEAVGRTGRCLAFPALLVCKLARQKK